MLCRVKSSCEMFVFIINFLTNVSGFRGKVLQICTFFYPKYLIVIFFCFYFSQISPCCLVQGFFFFSFDFVLKNEETRKALNKNKRI